MKAPKKRKYDGIATVLRTLAEQLTGLDDTIEERDALRVQNADLTNQMARQATRAIARSAEINDLKKQLATLAPDELADARVREELARSQEEYKKLEKRYNQVYNVCVGHVGIRTCRKCQGAYADGYICSCGWDNSYAYYPPDASDCLACGHPATTHDECGQIRTVCSRYVGTHDRSEDY